MNRIGRYYPNSDFEPKRESHLTPNLYDGNGTYVEVEISIKTGFVTIYWEDANDRHRVTYSMKVGTVLTWNTTPIRKSA